MIEEGMDNIRVKCMGKTNTVMNGCEGNKN